MSAVKILLGLFTLAVVMIMIGNGMIYEEPLQPLTNSSAFLNPTSRPDHSIELNNLLYRKGMRVGYNSRLSVDPDPETYRARNEKIFILSRGRRCTKMVPFM